MTLDNKRYYNTKTNALPLQAIFDIRLGSETQFSNNS